MTAATSLGLIAQADALPPTGGVRAILGMLFVLALVGTLAWYVRTGAIRLPGSRNRSPIAIEAALSLGERRSLVVVTVEGRRLLVGLTPAQVSLVTELGPQPPAGFESALDKRLGESGRTG